MNAKRTSWEIQKSVIFALLMRELKTRFGEYRLGYFWALFEPLTHVALFVVIFGFIMDRTMPGVSYPVFLITGIMPWLLFSNTVSRGMVAVKSNTALFSYRQVKPMDAIVARLILETLIQMLVFSFLLLCVLWAGGDLPFVDPMRAILSLTVLIFLASGIAIILCIISTLYQEIAKIIPILLRPLYFMSGIFWSLNTVPDQFHGFLLWNPVLHIIESVRESLFRHYQVPTEVNLLYPAMLAVLVLWIGFALYRENITKLVAT